MTIGNLNLLVVSDIHAFDGDVKDDSAPSHFSIRPQYRNSDSGNPLRSIPAVVQAAGLPVDWVVCAGDLADRADPAAQDATWSELAQLKTALKARLLVGAVGNHDIDSRFSFDIIDTKGTLQSLTPFFPGFEEAKCDFFWSRNFAIYEEDNVVLVNLNSAAFHGINSDHEKPDHREYEYGRVSDRTIAAILSKLPKDSKPLHVLLTHHHFATSDGVAGDEKSMLQNGQALLAKLAAATKTTWFVLHGHRHYPEINYGRGDESSPVIFSAGSLSRKLNELAAESANQFYHIHFPIDRVKAVGLEAAGVCQAWDWVPGQGWKEARNIARIPARAGFGCRTAAGTFAHKIDALVPRTGTVLWEKLVETIPELEFALPATLTRLQDALKTKGIAVWGTPFSRSCSVCRE